MEDNRTIYRQILEDVLPNALSIGVDYELFWDLDPDTLQPFVKAFTLSQEHKDLEAWRLGHYMQFAVGSMLSKDVQYPDKPFSYDGYEEELDEETGSANNAIVRERLLRMANKLA